MIGKAARIAAILVVPLAGLAALWAQSETLSREGTDWEVPVQGYDPRDLLRGHYVEFQYDWPVRREEGEDRDLFVSLMTRNTDTHGMRQAESRLSEWMVSTYGPDVSPQDFHAVVEVYLDGGWHLIDPTGMAKAEDMAIIGVGRDAVDIAFLTGFAPLTLKKQTVSVHRIGASSGPLARPTETATLT